MKRNFTIYIPITPGGRICYACATDTAADAKNNAERGACVTWGKLLTEGWRVVKFEGRKGAK
jgi:hypothetical protein